MNRLERLHALSETLRRAAPQPVSAATLAERFNVTRRTIERDLAALREAGVPLYAEHGRTGGQVSLDHLGRSVLTLSAAEITALLVAVKVAGAQMPFHDAGTTAAERLVEALGPTSQLAVDDLRSRVRVGDDVRSSPRIRRSVEEAVRRQVVLNLGYRDANGLKTNRSVDPVGFFRGDSGWHLVGWCHLREAGRLFRLDRITSARLTRRACAQHDVDETLGWVPVDTVAP